MLEALRSITSPFGAGSQQMMQIWAKRAPNKLQQAHFHNKLLLEFLTYHMKYENLSKCSETNTNAFKILIWKIPKHNHFGQHWQTWLVTPENIIFDQKLIMPWTKTFKKSSNFNQASLCTNLHINHQRIILNFVVEIEIS